MKMEKEEARNEQQREAHCLILSFPIQGHINPMLQFAKRIHQKGISITFIVTNKLAKETQFSSTIISLETISDGFDDGAPPGTPPDEYMARFNEVGPATLRDAIQRLSDADRPAGCLIYDPFLPWALDVAEEMGLLAAAFFTQAAAVDHIYHHVYSGGMKLPLASSEEVLIPGLPALKPEDFPSFVYIYGSYPPLFEVVVDQFRGLEKVDWLLFNTFYALEKEVMDYMAKTAPVKAIGPTIPSMYLDKRLPDDREYGLSVFKPVISACMDWLNEQRPDSVIYVSFGSLAQLGEAQMGELAWGLKLTNKHFLWVVRSTEESKLPKDFAQEVKDKGLMVSWCPQLDVLAHEAIGCFVTHCGWNSTLEAVSLGVPMVGIPQWTDQSTNAKFITDVWKMGVKAPVGGDGLVGRETIATCIRDVMEGERGKEIKKNVIKWKELAREAMDEGGNSDRNIEEFVATLHSKCNPKVAKENAELNAESSSS